jgi:FkbM family methyltransferase
MLPNGAAGIRARIAERLPIPERHEAVEGPHAQFGEDRILAEIFADRTGGWCAEVGAYDGLTGSATLHFERAGWQCLLVEPNPESAERISRARSSVVKQCAASSAEGETVLFVAESVEQMSTLEPDGAHLRWIEEVGGRVKPIGVRTARLDDLLDEAGFPELQFLTIDVEGHELEVLRGLSLERFKPRVVILEENLGRRRSAVARHMAEHRYVNFRRTGVNDWYALREDTQLVQRAALRRFRVERQILRLEDGCLRFLERHLPPPVKRALGRLARRVRAGR